MVERARRVSAVWLKEIAVEMAAKGLYVSTLFVGNSGAIAT